MSGQTNLRLADGPLHALASSFAKLGSRLGGSSGSEPTRLLVRSLAIVTLVTLVTAYFSETYFHIDEHYQVLEFMSYKLGKTAPGQLPWEFRAHIRPWMQPFLYFLIAKSLLFAGIKDLFDITFVLRLSTGLISLAALAVFAKVMTADFERDDEKLAYARSLPLLGYLPYLFVRTSSETLSAAFFTLGLALVARDARSASVGRVVAAGLLSGLAFEVRFQSAILVLGLLLWLALIARMRVITLIIFVLAASAPVAAALPIDHWGYGEWCFPPWGYLRDNLFAGIAAKRFGAAPFYAYIYMFPATIFLPIAAVLFIAMIITCLRNPRHVVTWTVLPFFVIHSAIAHKEERFLFPLAILATTFPILAFAPSRERWFPVFAQLWPYRRSIAAKAVAATSVAAMIFLAVYPFGFNAQMPIAKYVYRHFPQKLVAYSFDAKPFESYPMFRPAHFESNKLHSASDLEALIARGPVYLLSDSPVLPDGVLPRDARATLVYTELPFGKNVRIATLATRAMRAYNRIQAQIDWAEPPRLAWITLYRIERARPSGSS